jgi:hypothetical protein
LKALEHGLELLVSVLDLLDLTGQLPDLILQSVDSDQKLCRPNLGECHSRDRHDTGECNGAKGDTVRHRSHHRRERSGRLPTIAEAASKL